MRTNPLPRPAVIDIVPASEVGALIEQTDREFTELERRAAETTAAAEEAERRAQVHGVDPKSSAWTMVRLQRFLDSLRLEARRDAQATTEVATHRARVRIEEARTGNGAHAIESDLMWSTPTSFTAHTPLAGSAGRVPPTRTPTPLAVRPEPPMDGEPEPPAARVIPAPLPCPSADAPTNGHAPGLAEDPRATRVVTATALRPQPEPTIVAPAPTGAREQATPVAMPASAPVVAPAPAPEIPQPVAPTVQRPVPVPAPAPAAAPQAKAPKHAGRRRRIPVAAILEVVAVLLVLVFILLRLS